MTLLGWGIGGLVGGVMADYVGRKRMMLWSIFLYALFSGLTIEGLLAKNQAFQLSWLAQVTLARQLPTNQEDT